MKSNESSMTPETITTLILFFIIGFCLTMALTTSSDNWANANGLYTKEQLNQSNVNATYTGYIQALNDLNTKYIYDLSNYQVTYINVIYNDEKYQMECKLK